MTKAADAPLVADVADDAARWAHAMAQVAAERAADYAAIDQFILTFCEAWPEEILVDEGWENSLRTLRNAGLTPTALRYAVSAALGAPNVAPRNRFRYFAGVCWREIRTMQAMAAKRMQEEEDAWLDYPDPDPEPALSVLCHYVKRRAAADGRGLHLEDMEYAAMACVGVHRQERQWLELYPDVEALEVGIGQYLPEKGGDL